MSAYHRFEGSKETIIYRIRVMIKVLRETNYKSITSKIYEQNKHLLLVNRYHVTATE